ncbi:response regulator transcription factor [Actinopolymorpha sp. NPDC004070]|uniref:response regulator transcription factor n=1 Tax=Actinopolymorpha sp. NPDC004070 TaxID=3154548 RepID=UPI0033B647BA
MVAAVWTVAVCEDDAALRSVLTRAIRSAGHEVVIAHDGGEALRVFPAASPDVMVIDIGLPDSDGRDVCLALRANGVSAPVLLLTALDATHDKVAGFEAGADDYLTKPFALPELLARISALGRRHVPAVEAQQVLRLDPSRHAVAFGERSLPLTPTEFRILAKLVGSAGQVVRRHTLVAAGWPMGAVVNDNTLDTYIRRLRRKVEKLGAPHSVETRRGVGYTWR